MARCAGDPTGIGIRASCLSRKMAVLVAVRQRVDLYSSRHRIEHCDCPRGMMPDEFVTELATALAVKGAELGTTTGNSARAGLGGRVRERVGVGTQGISALETAG